MITASTQLARHFVSLDLDALPSWLVAATKALVQDYLGVALGGSLTDSGRIAARFATDQGGPGDATLIGNGARVSAVQAAFANAIASHSIELDDVDELALFHFSPPVVSAALAVAEWKGASGAEFLTAVAAGCEMLARASAATNPSLRDRGFHTTPTCGTFAATVAASKLLDLDEGKMVSALGLAGAQASGLMEMYGPSMQKRFNPGPAARNGVTAALMADLGFTGTDLVFEGERGFLRAFCDEPDLTALTSGLGSDFPVGIEFKPYSSARPIHNAVDCVLDIRPRLDVPTVAIDEIVVYRHPDWANYHLNARPSTYHEAQVSLPYSVAVALVEGAALPPQYTAAKLADPELQRLSALVKVIPDSRLNRGVSCRVVVTAGDRTFESLVDHPLGSIERPMSPEERAAKVRMLAEPVIGAGRVAQLIKLLGGLELAPSVAPMTFLVGSPA